MKRYSCGNPKCRGYDIFHTGGGTVGHAEYGIERCDICSNYGNDSEAVLKFVADLERGEDWALRIATKFLEFHQTGDIK
ncbi:hypothetical protein LCGC14_2345100, partial [marine sediment metagenome]